MAKTRPPGRGGKLVRSQTVTVRLDARLRYLAELAALKQRRTVSSFIEWAIERGLNEVVLRDDGSRSATVANEAANLWDVDEPDRFVKLATLYPELLTHDQQLLWKVIRECDPLWRPVGLGRSSSSKRPLRPSDVDLARLRQAWEILRQIAVGTAQAKDLPAWPADEPSGNTIPF